MRAIANGRLRHLIGNPHCDHIDDGRDQVRARYYSFVTTWLSGGAFVCMALSTVMPARNPGGWLVKRNDTINLS